MLFVIVTCPPTPCGGVNLDIERAIAIAASIIVPGMLFSLPVFLTPIRRWGKSSTTRRRVVMATTTLVTLVVMGVNYSWVDSLGIIVFERLCMPPEFYVG